jgi:maleylacetoacetate isomerase
MEQDTVTLYDYWRSSAAYRVRIALGLLGLGYRAVPVNLMDGSHRSPENLSRNPQGLVPTLEIDGLVLTQSVAILEYLDETRTAGFLPKTHSGRARVRALAYAVAMEIAPVCNLSVRNFAAKASDGAITADAWQVHFMQLGLAAMERMLDHPATGLCCHGDSISIADICLVPQVYNARRVDIDLATYPRIAGIMAHLETNPAIAAAYPDLHKPTS